MSRAACEALARHAGVPVDDVVDYWHERAAIREHEGGQSRADAEAGALDDVRDVLALSVGDARKGPRSVAPRAADGAKKLGTE